MPALLPRRTNGMLHEMAQESADRCGLLAGFLIDG
jgi:hypothetical protein